MGSEFVKIGKPYIGTCHAGLIDFAAPIIVKGEHLGTVLGGRILDTNPKEEKMQKVVHELSLFESKLWEAA